MSFNARVAISDLMGLRLPAPEMGILEEIYRVEGQALTTSIERAKSGDMPAIEYLKGILFTVLPAVPGRLEAAQLSPPTIQLLVIIGKSAGPNFAKLLKQWVDEGCPDNKVGTYIRMTYAQALLNVAESDKQALLPDSAKDVSIEHGRRPVDANCDPQEAPTKKTYVNRHVYGGKVAVCFSADVNRLEEHTVRIEAAVATAARTYNWEQKIAIQLSTRELPSVLATLMQLQERFEGKGHGSQNEKWFSMANQPGKVYLTVNAKGQESRSLPIGPGDCYGIITLIMEQMLKNAPFLTPESLLTLIERTGRMAEVKG